MLLSCRVSMERLSHPSSILSPHIPLPQLSVLSWSRLLQTELNCVRPGAEDSEMPH